MASFATAFSDAIANSQPATQSSQTESFGQIIGSAVQGTVAVIQAIRQPTSVYKPPTAGTTAGSSTGAAQSMFASGSITWWLLGGAAVALVGALVLIRRK